MAFHNVPPNGFPDLPDVEELAAVEKDVKTLKTTTTEQGAAITALGTAKAAKADIAPTFSAESNYAVGDLVYYEGVLYECTTEHEAAAWDAEDFTTATIDGELSAVKSGLIDSVVFEPERAPDVDPFNTDGSGYLLRIKYHDTLLGYLVIRPKGYVAGGGSHKALELYNASWSPMWDVEYRVTN